MKKSIIKISFLCFVVAGLLMASCSVTEKVPEAIAQKSGAQLWGENCSRCHNAPGPGEFNDAHWEVIGMHMRTRANLTETETNKIVEFMKDANGR